LFEFSTPVLRTELASFVCLSSKNYNKLFKYGKTSWFIELHISCCLLISPRVLNSSDKITSAKLCHIVWHYLNFLNISNGKRYSCLHMMYKKYINHSPSCKTIIFLNLTCQELSLDCNRYYFAIGRFIILFNKPFVAVINYWSYTSLTVNMLKMISKCLFV